MQIQRVGFSAAGPRAFVSALVAANLGDRCLILLVAYTIGFPSIGGSNDRSRFREARLFNDDSVSVRWTYGGSPSVERSLVGAIGSAAQR
jgi:hypothetical protein